MKNTIKNFINSIWSFIKTNRLIVAIILIATLLVATMVISIGVYVATYPEPVMTADGSSDFSQETVVSSEHSVTSESLVSSEQVVSSEQETTVSKQETVSSAPVHKHSYAKKTIKPTCLEGGYTLYTCNCGKSYKDNATDQLGHNYSDWTVTKAATTTSTGTKECKCSRCGQKKTESIAKKASPSVKVDTSLKTETFMIGENWATRYYNNSCSILDTRTWGKTPSVSVQNKTSLHVVYYNQNNEKIEFDINPVNEYINSYTILEDGTYVSMLVGSYS